MFTMGLVAADNFLIGGRVDNSAHDRGQKCLFLLSVDVLSEYCKNGKPHT